MRFLGNETVVSAHRPYVAVIGSGADEPELTALAESVGRHLGRAGA